MGSSLPAEVTALSPATGRAVWRLGGGPPPSVVASGPAGVLLSSASPGHASLLDPATGRARWQVAAFIQYTDHVSQPGQVPGAIVTARDIISTEGQPAPSGPGGERIVDRSAADGSVRWTAPIPTMVAGGVPPLAAGTHVVVVTDSPAGRPATLLALDRATGRHAWQATMPAMMLAPPAAAGADVLAQSADPSYGCP
jgi:outer membrane protein assembly factor BamB